MASSHQKLLVVQPDSLVPLCRVGDWLQEQGVGWDTVRPFAGEQVPERLEYAGLVVLGGVMSSLDDDEYLWLEQIRALQRDAAVQGRPSLGICLGAQLMAQAFGGSTARGDQGLEAGVTRVDWLAAADDDPLMAGLPMPFASGTMHGDAVVDLPPRTTLLGTGSLYRHQAFRVGRTSWGVQFHPEIDHAAYQVWVDAHQDSSPNDLVLIREGGEDLRESEAEVIKGNRALVHNFVRVLDAAARDDE